MAAARGSPRSTASAGTASSRGAACGCARAPAATSSTSRSRAKTPPSTRSSRTTRAATTSPSWWTTIPARDLGSCGSPGHRFFFAPDEVEPLRRMRPTSRRCSPRPAASWSPASATSSSATTAFGVEVARRLVDRALPAGVRVVDFGIRGFDLAYALLDGPERHDPGRRLSPRRRARHGLRGRARPRRAGRRGAAPSCSMRTR